MEVQAIASQQYIARKTQSSACKLPLIVPTVCAVVILPQQNV